MDECNWVLFKFRYLLFWKLFVGVIFVFRMVVFVFGCKVFNIGVLELIIIL